MEHYMGNPNYGQFAQNMDNLSFELLPLADYDYDISKVQDQENYLGDHDQYSLSESTELSEKLAIRDETNINNNDKNGVIKRNKEEAAGGVSRRVAFRTKTALEVMDDGYKWRKYGKKSVKNSPNPRNYYKCSNGGCFVKKRVERDRDDPSYVITTYEGLHNHEIPGAMYYNQMQYVFNSEANWTFQASAAASSSSEVMSP